MASTTTMSLSPRVNGLHDRSSSGVNALISQRAFRNGSISCGSIFVVIQTIAILKLHQKCAPGFAMCDSLRRGWNIGLDRTVEQSGMDLFHHRFDWTRNSAIQVVIWCICDMTEIIAARKNTIAGELNQIEDTRVDELNRAGKHPRSGFGQGKVLVSIYADHVCPRLGGGCNCTITSQTPASKYQIRALVHHGLGGRRTPMGISERLIKTDIAVVYNDDFGHDPCELISIDRAGLIAFAIAPVGRGHICRADRAYLVALTHHRGESANKEARLIFREVQTRNTFHLINLKLIHTDEVDIRIFPGGNDCRVTKGGAHRDDHVIVCITELRNVPGVIPGVGGFD